MVEFAGFELPVQYTSLAEEHQAVRERAGVFDVSHMGEIAIRGPKAFDFVQLVSCNDHTKMTVGRAQYTGLMYPEATFVDDVLVHKMAEDDFLLVVNAANKDKDVAYLQDLARDFDGAEVVDLSSEYAQIAIQGPLAQEVLQPLVDTDLGELKYYRFILGEAAGHPAMIARTGYTGEDGFEVYVDPACGSGLWRAILAEGQPKGVQPAGLGARDTLRFEAGMCLYGNDIDATTTPLEAGLGWIVKFGKGDFIGRDVLERQKEEGVERRLAGLEMLDRGIARHGYEVNACRRRRRGGMASSHQAPSRQPLAKRSRWLTFPPRRREIGREVCVQIRNRSDSGAGGGASVLLAEEKVMVEEIELRARRKIPCRYPLICCTTVPTIGPGSKAT